MVTRDVLLPYGQGLKRQHVARKKHVSYFGSNINICRLLIYFINGAGRDTEVAS
jgi:hypothetical protein